MISNYHKLFLALCLCMLTSGYGMSPGMKRTRDEDDSPLNPRLKEVSRFEIPVFESGEIELENGGRFITQSPTHHLGTGRRTFNGGLAVGDNGETEEERELAESLLAVAQLFEKK